MTLHSLSPAQVLRALLAAALSAVFLALPSALSAQETSDPAGPPSESVDATTPAGPSVDPSSEPAADPAADPPVKAGDGQGGEGTTDPAGSAAPPAQSAPPVPPRQLAVIDKIKEQMAAACQASAKFCGMTVQEFCAARTDACGGLDPCDLNPEKCDVAGGGGGGNGGGGNGGGGDPVCRLHPEKCGGDIVDVCRQFPEKCAEGGDFCARHPRRCMTGNGLPPQPVLGAVLAAQGAACGCAQPEGSLISGRMRVSLADGTVLGRARSVCVRPGIGVDLVQLSRPLGGRGSCLALRSGSYRIN